MTAAVCGAILNNGENIGKFGIRKRAFELIGKVVVCYGKN